MVSEKTAPLIGMPARMDPGKDNQYLSRHYAESVSGSGGVPIILPLLEDPRVLDPLVGGLDGILLTGSSSDVDPGLYGAEISPQCGPVQRLRDRTDYYLLERALMVRRPVLAICYGVQSLNVFLGGSLIQDLPSSIPSTVNHSQPRTKGKAAHRVDLAEGSILYQLAGAPTAAVNSTHHQALDRLGSGLDVIARAADGVIEAVCGISADQWILGVQWHPEKSYSFDLFSKRIFHIFLARCGAK